MPAAAPHHQQQAGAREASVSVAQDVIEGCVPSFVRGELVLQVLTDGEHS